jgi:cardiolipin synthase A/B
VDPSDVVLVLAVLLVVVDFVIRVVALVVIPRNRRPQTAMAWLLAIFFLPYIGILLFLLLGSRHLPKRRRDKQQAISRYILETTEGTDLLNRDAPWPPWLEPIAELNRTLGAMPLVGGNTATLLTDYAKSLQTMTDAVARAARYVHVEFYIMALDPTSAPFFDALEAAAKRGVIVRVLLDHLASRRSPGYFRTIRRLKKMGVQWHLMLPVQPLRGRFQRPDLRNHRKILVVDGAEAFMGSQNLIEPGYDKEKNHRAGREWVELTCRVTGPVVAALDAVFATDWYSEPDELLMDELVPATADPGGDLTCQVIPSGPGFATENNLRAFTTLLYSARRRISITSPYFVPDESLLYAVTTAAHRGIDVELFVSEEGDQFMVYHAQCSYYDALLEAGVRIYLYPAPYVLHSKHFSIDEDVAVLGSSNMDLRSFGLNCEVSLMLEGGDIVSRMRKVEDAYRMRSRELTQEEWARRPWRSRYADNVMRLTSALQ